MEKENMPMEHGKTCGWCGLDRGFSWLRLVLTIVIGLFIFFAGMVIGQARAMHGYGNSRMMMHGRWNQDGQGMVYGTPGADGLGVPVTETTTVVSPAQPAAPATTVAPAPAK